MPCGGGVNNHLEVVVFVAPDEWLQVRFARARRFVRAVFEVTLAGRDARSGVGCVPKGIGMQQ